MHDVESSAPEGNDGWQRDERLEKLHRVMLMMLKDFSAICEKEGLDWVAMYGTAIGALRHKGFIPWDDDIDICMLRPDLERFTEVVSRDYSDKYEMIDARIDGRYPMLTSRFMLKGTEFRDSALATMDFDSGIFLDLFPLDDVPDDEAAYRRQGRMAWLFNKLAIVKLVGKPFIAGGGLRAFILKAGTFVMKGIVKLPGVRGIDFNEKALAWHTLHAGEESSRVAYLGDTSPFTCTYRREDLFPARSVPFEDMQIPVPHSVEKLLEELYGDYMTPPPLEDRKAHYPDILDFGPYGE